MSNQTPKTDGAVQTVDIAKMKLWQVIAALYNAAVRWFNTTDGPTIPLQREPISDAEAKRVAFLIHSPVYQNGKGTGILDNHNDVPLRLSFYDHKTVLDLREYDKLHGGPGAGYAALVPLMGARPSTLFISEVAKSIRDVMEEDVVLKLNLEVVEQLIQAENRSRTAGQYHNIVGVGVAPSNFEELRREAEYLQLKWEILIDPSLAEGKCMVAFTRKEWDEYKMQVQLGAIASAPMLSIPDDAKKIRELMEGKARPFDPSIFSGFPTIPPVETAKMPRPPLHNADKLTKDDYAKGSPLTIYDVTQAGDLVRCVCVLCQDHAQRGGEVIWDNAAAHDRLNTDAVYVRPHKKTEPSKTQGTVEAEMEQTLAQNKELQKALKLEKAKAQELGAQLAKVEHAYNEALDRISWFGLATIDKMPGVREVYELNFRFDWAAVNSVRDKEGLVREIVEGGVREFLKSQEEKGDYTA